MFDPFLDEQFNDGDGDDEIFTDDEMAAPNYQSRSSKFSSSTPYSIQVFLYHCSTPNRFSSITILY